MMLIRQSINSDWLSITQPRVLQPDWFILEINEKATLNISIAFMGKVALEKGLANAGRYFLGYA